MTIGSPRQINRLSFRQIQQTLVLWQSDKDYSYSKTFPIAYLGEEAHIECSVAMALRGWPVPCYE